MQQIKPTIVIIGGTGKMGQWFQGFFKEHGISVVIHGRKSKESLSEVVKQADIIVVSVPISEVKKTIKKILPNVKNSSLLCDISSLKVVALNAMQGASCGTLGMHPLFGPSLLSPQGQKVVFCRQNDNAYVKFLHSLFQKSGIEIIEMTADDHDRQMAIVQALTHTVNILFAQTIASLSIPLDTRVQTPVFKLQSLTMQRVLQQNPALLADIQLLNPHFLPILEMFYDKMKDLLKVNTKKNKTALIEVLEKEHIDQKRGAGFALTQTNKIIQMLQDTPVPVRTDNTASKTLQNLKITYLGPNGTNTHQAAESIFHGGKNTFLPQQTLETVFLEIGEGKADVGVVPAENSLHGTVRETLDLLSNSPLVTLGSFDLPIHHALLSLETDFSKIKTVISHPQALAQCRHFLTEHLPHAKQIPASSTTAALLNPKKEEAYISSEKASSIYKIPLMAKNIEDTLNNTTRFYVISDKDQYVAGIKRENTLLFLTIYNRVGILRDILDVFAVHNISLNKLESRPSLEKIWDYCFYIEVDQTEESKQLQLALTELQNLCSSIRVLGRT